MSEMGKGLRPVVKAMYEWIEKYDIKQVSGNRDGKYFLILYINAAADDGSETAKLMRYFKTADPNDMSQGDLSKRVHFLKCEEGGYEIMCEISEMIYAEGREMGRTEGELNAKRAMAYNMHKKGYSDSMIAELLEVRIPIVREWIDSEIATID